MSLRLSSANSNRERRERVIRRNPDARPGKMPARRVPPPECRRSFMHRRDVLKGFVATGALAAFAPAARAAPAGWRQFEITYRVELAAKREPALVWVPVPQDALDYQRVVDLTW